MHCELCKSVTGMRVPCVTAFGEVVHLYTQIRPPSGLADAMICKKFTSQ